MLSEWVNYQGKAGFLNWSFKMVFLLILASTNQGIFAWAVTNGICDQAWENRSYLHKLHLFVLWHLSYVLYELSKICYNNHIAQNFDGGSFDVFDTYQLDHLILTRPIV